MSYQLPEMLEGGTAVERERARTEILAKAFDEASGRYFERLAQYEDNISDAESEQSRMQKLGAGAVIGGVLLLVLGIADNGGSSALFAGLGILVALVGAGYAYKRYTDAEERIGENERRIEENDPDGEVTFVSRVGVPMYLVPYQDDFMLFDSLNVAPETRLDLANVDADTLLTQQQELSDLKTRYDDLYADETVVSPDAVEQFAPDATAHRRLESPLIDRIDAMTGVAQDIDRDTVHANVWANDQKTTSIGRLSKQGLLDSEGDLLQVPTRQSIEECEAIVDDIRGVEEQAVSGDILDQVRGSRERVDEIATELAERLRANERRVDDHYDRYGSRVDAAVTKHVCAECLRDRIDDVVAELGLVDQILSPEAGSFGIALDDEDLDRGTDESFTERIRRDIEAAVPELDGELRRAYNRLDDLGDDGGFCQIHGQVDTRQVADSGALFGEVWRSLYYTFRGPIMDSVDDLEQEAEEIRQNKEQKMVDLTQYEQIKDEAEQRYLEVKSDYETARHVERELR